MGLAGKTVVLKLKTADFRLRTRSASLSDPTQLADRIFRTALPALKREANGTRFRLLGVGLSNLAPASEADPASLDRSQRATNARRRNAPWTRYGGEAVAISRSFRTNGP